MLTTLIKYLGILGLGAVFAYKDLVGDKLEANLNKLQTICLLFLLFVMGISIGINDKVIKNIFSIGVRAGVISLFTIVFSILAVMLVKKFIVLDGDNIEP